MSAWKFSHLLQPRKSRAEDFLTERIRLESISTAIGAVGVMLIASVMFFIFPKDLPQSRYLGLWVLAQLLANSAWLLFIARHAKYPKPNTARLWPYLCTAICSFNGFMWGMGWAFFVGDIDNGHSVAAVMFTIILSGVFTGGLLATLFHLPSLLLFTFNALLPPLVSTITHHGLFHFWFGLSMVIYMLACTAFAYNLHVFLLDTLKQREEKTWLAGQLALEKQRVEQISQEKTRFLAAASHDLRQPLQALQFFQQTLGEILGTPGSTENPLPVLERIKTATQALDSLLNSLLDITKLDAGIQEFERRHFLLDAILRSIYRQYAPLAAMAGLELRYVPTGVYVDSDPIQLGRIIQNLVDNAIKHMGNQGRILLGVRRCQGFVRVEVWDNGIGIPHHEQEKVFHEFYQCANPERNRDKGTGLGLFTVRRLATLLGHTLELHSLGKGCVFSVQVPLVAYPSVLPAAGDLSPVAANPKGRVLIIEDDEFVQDSLRTLLNIWGYSPIIADTLDPQTIVDGYPDIHFIISDYQLSADQTGLELIGQVRGVAGWKIPALLITGNTSVALTDELKASDIPLSYKPLNPMVLKNIITNANSRVD